MTGGASATKKGLCGIDQVYAVKVRLTTGGRQSLKMAYYGLRGRVFANR
jgi:hypothetical protein